MGLVLDELDRISVRAHRSLGAPIYNQAILRRFIFWLSFLNIVFFRARAEISEVRMLRQVVKKGDFLIEVGARTGATTKIISSLVGTEGRVISMEPNPYCSWRMKRTAESLKNVFFLGLAANDKDGFADYFLGHADDPGGSLFAHKFSKAITVRTITLDNVVSMFGWLKVSGLVIDAEGSELAILRSASATLERARFVWVEIHGKKTSKSDLDALMASYSFTLNEESFDGVPARLYIKK